MGGPGSSSCAYCVCKNLLFLGTTPSGTTDNIAGELLTILRIISFHLLFYIAIAGSTVAAAAVLLLVILVILVVLLRKCRKNNSSASQG